jgi:hypothetical protein
MESLLTERVAFVAGLLVEVVVGEDEMVLRLELVGELLVEVDFIDDVDVVEVVDDFPDDVDVDDS